MSASLAMRSFCWSLDKPLSSAISVMADTDDPEIPMAPYCSFATGHTWHPVSQSPLTEPKISSVTVHVDQLEEWEDVWYTAHDGHHDPDEDNPDEDNPDEDNPDEDNPDEDNPDEEFRFSPDETGEVFLTRCCNHESPQSNTEFLTVQASGAFLTIHEYVSAVHPWLMGLRDDILRVEADFGGPPWSADTRLMVQFLGPDYIHVEDEKAWKRRLESQKRLGSLPLRNKDEADRDWAGQKYMPDLAHHLHERTKNSLDVFSE